MSKVEVMLDKGDVVNGARERLQRGKAETDGRPPDKVTNVSKFDHNSNPTRPRKTTPYALFETARTAVDGLFDNTACIVSL